MLLLPPFHTCQDTIISSYVISAWQTLDCCIACFSFFFTLSTWPSQIQNCLFFFASKDTLCLNHGWTYHVIPCVCNMPETSASNLQTNVILIAWRIGNVWKPLLRLFGMTLNLRIFPGNSRKHTFCVRFQIMTLFSWLLWASLDQWELECQCLFTKNMYMYMVCVCVCKLCSSPNEVVILKGKTCLIHYCLNILFHLIWLTGSHPLFMTIEHVWVC